MTQCDLYRKNLDEKFAEYHMTNPTIFAKFVFYAEQLKAAGRRRIGAKAIVERIRWDSLVSAIDGDYKINNNYTSRYVRMLSVKRPDLAPMFATRQLKS
jgi:hypothetical protein